MSSSRPTSQQARNTVLRAETLGILIVVLLAFVLVLVRYGRFIDWHAR